MIELTGHIHMSVYRPLVAQEVSLLFQHARFLILAFFTKALQYTIVGFNGSIFNFLHSLR